MAKNCWSSSSLSSGRIRQVPSKLKSRTQVARELLPSPQGTTASTTPPFVRAGYDCQNKHHRPETPRSRGVGTPRVIRHH